MTDNMEISAGRRFGAFCEKWLPLCMAGLAILICAFLPEDRLAQAARETVWLFAVVYLAGAAFVLKALDELSSMPLRVERMLRDSGVADRLPRLHREALAWLALAAGAAAALFASGGTHFWTVLHFGAAAGACFALRRSAGLARAASKLSRAAAMDA